MHRAALVVNSFAHRIAAAACVSLCAPAAAQFNDTFDDEDLDGWTVSTTGSASVDAIGGTMNLGSAGSGEGRARFDPSVDASATFAAGNAAIDFTLDIGGRPIEAGIEIVLDDTSGEAMVFAVFPNNPGGPGATIGYRPAEGAAIIKLAAPALTFSLSSVRVFVQWDEGEYKLTVTNVTDSSQSGRFTIDMPPPPEACIVEVFARPIPGAGSSSWLARADNFRALALNTEACLGDVNGDTQLNPADFTAWVIAFNDGAPECDQNLDGLCNPADFSAWVINFNNGCD
ncbi:MAG: hypothetical protein AAFN41_13240 [Planctomycetota bacterium]